MTRHLAVGVLACAAWLTACSGSSSSASASASLQGPLLVSDGSWNGGMAGLVGGPLARIGTCIGAGGSMVVWPEGVRWDEQQESLVLADGALVGLGQEVHGGGGSMDTAAVNTLFGSDAADALKQCGVEVGSEVMVFNVGSGVTAGPAG
ncbi:hypothetical protein [Kineococcus sp. SYSU DK005]|uniref:hypothetical protein n=1 Tax=Kineococcus sp. SYSU DK005 TaxID=3383126 RepID=UPI003D7E5C69